ncbi:MAG: endolytic transglycosylase MltG [Betaproteobacteria bacterium]
MSRSSYRIVLFALACVLSAGAVGVYLSQELDRETLVTEDAQLFVVNEGDGIIRVLDALENQGVIRSAQASRLALTLQSQTLIMKPGEYRLRPTETLRELLHRINNNDVVVTKNEDGTISQVTDPDGEIIQIQNFGDTISKGEKFFDENTQRVFLFAGSSLPTEGLEPFVQSGTQSHLRSGSFVYLSDLQRW